MNEWMNKETKMSCRGECKALHAYSSSLGGGERERERETEREREREREMCARFESKTSLDSQKRNKVWTLFWRFFWRKKLLKGSAMLLSWQHCASPFLQLRDGPQVRQKICITRKLVSLKLICVNMLLTLNLAALIYISLYIYTYIRNMSVYISCVFVSFSAHGWWFLFCWPCACFFCFVWARGFCLSFLCAMCSHVNLSWPHPYCFLIIG